MVQVRICGRYQKPGWSYVQPIGWCPQDINGVAFDAGSGGYSWIGADGVSVAELIGQFDQPVGSFIEYYPGQLRIVHDGKMIGFAEIKSREENLNVRTVIGLVGQASKVRDQLFPAGSVVVDPNGEVFIVEFAQNNATPEELFVIQQSGKRVDKRITTLSVLDEKYWPEWVTRLKSGNEKVKSVQFDETFHEAICVDPYEHNMEGVCNEVTEFLRQDGRIELIDGKLFFLPNEIQTEVKLGDRFIRLASGQLIKMSEQDYYAYVSAVQVPK